MGSPSSSEKKRKEKKTKSGSNDEYSAKLKTLQRKQKEVARVLKLKTELILQGNLPFLEYIEMQEEIARLRNLTEALTLEAEAMES